MTDFKKIRSEPSLTAYIKTPEGNGPFPAVIVFMHRPGADESQQKVADDLAKAGFIGILHDSYREESIKDEYTDDTIFEDFEYTLNYIKNNLPQIDKDRIGIIGFCMGGRHVYLAASRYPELKAAVSYYGFPAQGTTDVNTPMKQVENMSVPVLGIFGKQDHLFPFSDVEKFEKLLVPLSNKHKIIAYDDVGHGFLNPYSEKRYGDGVSAGKAWEETISFYKKNF